MVRVLLLGAAFSADLHLHAYSRISQKVKIVAICNKSRERAKSIIKKFELLDCQIFDNIDEAISKVDCDVVDICLPTYLHHKAAIKAFTHNRHVISEKPLAMNVSQAQEMVDHAHKADRKLFYAEDWFFAPALIRAIEIIKEGAIGRVLYVKARECHSGSHSPYSQKKEFCGGGAMMHIGIHPLGFVLGLLGYEWKELVAMTSGGYETNLKLHSLEGEDWSAAIVKFEDSVAFIEGNYVTQGGIEDGVDIYGSEGTMHIDLTLSSPIHSFSRKGINYVVEKTDVTTGWSRPVVDEHLNLGYYGEIEHFIECVEKNSEASLGVRGIDGLEVQKVMERLYESAAKGITIKRSQFESSF